MVLTEQEKERIAEEEELRVEIRTRAYLRNFSYSLLLVLLYGLGIYLMYYWLGSKGYPIAGLLIGFAITFLGTYMFLRRLDTG